LQNDPVKQEVGTGRQLLTGITHREDWSDYVGAQVERQPGLLHVRLSGKALQQFSKEPTAFIVDLKRFARQTSYSERDLEVLARATSLAHTCMGLELRLQLASELELKYINPEPLGRDPHLVQPNFTMKNVSIDPCAQSAQGHLAYVEADERRAEGLLAVIFPTISGEGAAALAQAPLSAVGRYRRRRPGAG
jgi:hypothetical protein